ncbi:MAG: hypothetical protein KDA86_15240 [Planctomycetaceae bacterium]|nr:hypothetical protein [Planctomycetaceae bacterium]
MADHLEVVGLGLPQGRGAGLHPAADTELHQAPVAAAGVRELVRRRTLSIDGLGFIR